jgi:hypothetical protein
MGLGGYGQLSAPDFFSATYCRQVLERRTRLPVDSISRLTQASETGMRHLSIYLVDLSLTNSLYFG